MSQCKAASYFSLSATQSWVSLIAGRENGLKQWTGL